MHLRLLYFLHHLNATPDLRVGGGAFTQYVCNFSTQYSSFLVNIENKAWIMFKNDEIRSFF